MRKNYSLRAKRSYARYYARSVSSVFNVYKRFKSRLNPKPLLFKSGRPYKSIQKTMFYPLSVGSRYDRSTLATLTRVPATYHFGNTVGAWSTAVNLPSITFFLKNPQFFSIIYGYPLRDLLNASSNILRGFGEGVR